MSDTQLPPFEPVGRLFGFRGVPATIAITRAQSVQLDSESEKTQQAQPSQTQQQGD